mgnify:CR=1 FL=1
MELDPTKINIWKEYFCRYDEGKREYMTQQVQWAEANIQRTISLESLEQSLEQDCQKMIEILKMNQKRIDQIRNLKSPEEAEEDFEELLKKNPTGGLIEVEVAKNGSIVLTAQDLDVIDRI